MDVLPLQPSVFAILRGLIEARGGLHYEPVDRELLANRISPRAVALGFDSLLDYYYFLRYDPAGEQEFENLLEVLLVHETYFFREAEQLTQLVECFLAPMVKAGSRPRVWCAAASSGEEPYTLAMLLAEQKILEQVELVATDLSSRILEHARAGLYSGRALRSVLGTVADRWMVKHGEKVQVLPELREAISWKRVNLVDAAQVEALGQFDAILCRNVLIYFNDATIIHVIRQVTAALKPGGTLLVGASESLTRFGTSLDCDERAGSFFYRKSA